MSDDEPTSEELIHVITELVEHIASRRPKDGMNGNLPRRAGNLLNLESGESVFRRNGQK
jgi:hypothetical protein